MKIDKYDNLLIRACKKCTENEATRKRLRKIWLWRCGLSKNYKKEKLDLFIISRLAKLHLGSTGEKNFDIEQFIYDISPNKAWLHSSGEDYDFWNNVFNVLISKITLTDPKKFDNYIAPLIFKRRRG